MKYIDLFKTIVRKDIHSGCFYVLKKDLESLTNEEYKCIIKNLNKYDIKIVEYVSSNNTMLRDIYFFDNINLLDYESWLKKNDISFNQLLSEKDTLYLINKSRMNNNSFREKIIKENMVLVEYLLCKFSNVFNICIDEYRTYAYEVLIEIIDNYNYNHDLYEYITKKIFLELFNEYCCNEGISLDNFSSLRNYIEIKYDSDYNEYNFSMYSDVVDILFNEGLLYYDTKNILLEKYTLERYSSDIEISDEYNVNNNFDYINFVHLLDRILSTLKVREENIIRYYYGIGTKKYGLTDLMNKYGVTKSSVISVLKNARYKIRDSLLSYYDKNRIQNIMYMDNINYTIDEANLFNCDIDDDFINKLFFDYINNKCDRKDLRIADLNRKKLINKAIKGNSKAMYICMNIFNWIRRDYALKIYDKNTKIDNISLYIDYIDKYFYMLLNDELNKYNVDLVNKAIESGNDKALYIYLRKNKGFANCLKIKEMIDRFPFDYKVDGIYSMYDNIDLGSFYSASRLYVYHKQKYNKFIEEENFWGELGERILDLVENNIINKYTLDECSMYTALRFNKISKEVALKNYDSDYEFSGIRMFEGSNYSVDIIGMIDKVYEDDINFFDNYSKEAKYLKRYIQAVIAEAECGNDKAYHLLEQVHEIIDDKKYIEVVKNYMDSKTKILKK